MMMSARNRLRTLLDQHGDDIPLDEGVICINVEERPEGVSPFELRAELDALAHDVRLPANDVVDAVARLNHHLFVHLGFNGDADEYDHPDNSMIAKVLARRRGLPILLSVLYIEIARRCGLSIQGIGFPSHFLVQPVGQPFYIDPFHQGRILRFEQLQIWLSQLFRGAVLTPEVFAQATAPVSRREILIRINRNLKRTHLRREDIAPAIRASERILLLDPTLAEERRDLGRMLIAMGNVEAGTAELAHYLVERPTAPDAWQLYGELERLKRE